MLWLWLSIAVLLAAAYWQRRPLLFWTMETCLWTWFLRNVVRKLRLTTGLTRMNAKKYHAVWAAIRPGDVIMGTDNWKPGHRWGTPGLMAHGALCVRVNGLVEPLIAEMIDGGGPGEDFNLISLSEFCYHYDRVLVLRCRDFTQTYIKDTVIPTCWAYSDAEYDRSFVLGNRSQCCFELPFVADKEGRMELVPRSFFGKKILIADSYIEAPNVDVIVDTDASPSFPVLQGD